MDTWVQHFVNFSPFTIRIERTRAWSCSYQSYHFSGISGNLEMSANSAEVRKKSGKRDRSGNLCSQGWLTPWHNTTCPSEKSLLKFLIYYHNRTCSKRSQQCIHDLTTVSRHNISLYKIIMQYWRTTRRTHTLVCIKLRKTHDHNLTCSNVWQWSYKPDYKHIDRLMCMFEQASTISFYKHQLQQSARSVAQQTLLLCSSTARIQWFRGPLNSSGDFDS